MLILLTNDDGIESDGLRVLANELVSLAKIIVVAPSYERSAISHSLSVYTPVVLNRRFRLRGNIECYSLNATPADCVKIALADIMKKMPDMVISGINRGANLGINIYYSGTVAGAVEGALNQIPSIAVSQEYREKMDFKRSARFIKKLIKNKKFFGFFFNQKICLNINIPADSRKIKGVKITAQNIQPFKDAYMRRISPKGQLYYWIKSNPELDGMKSCKYLNDTDAIKRNYISITPFDINRTSWNTMEELRYINITH